MYTNWTLTIFVKFSVVNVTNIP